MEGTGSYKSPSGSTYAWAHKNDRTNGHRFLTYSDGKKYKSKLKDGKPHGEGKLADPDGQLTKNMRFWWHKEADWDRFVNVGRYWKNGGEGLARIPETQIMIPLL